MIMFQIYSIGNLNDVTWGTRGEIGGEGVSKEEELERKKFRNYRYTFFAGWLVANVMYKLLYFFRYVLAMTYVPYTFYFYYISSILLFTYGCRFLGSMWFLGNHIFSRTSIITKKLKIKSVLLLILLLDCCR